MNKEIKQKWVEALRSGKYEQGTGQLKKNGKYCCLGVLCHIIHARKWAEDEVLPDHVVKRVGLSANDPQLTQKGDKQWISFLNDEGMSFNKLADLIEAQL